MSYANLLLPHPVIRPDGFDYRSECSFNMQINKATCTRDKINLELSYELHSVFISNMIKKEKAKVFAMIKCSKTNQRVMFDFTETHRSLDLQLTDYAGKINIIPYVVTTEEIHNFKSEEHDDEIQKLRPDGMDLPTGAILAIGEQHEITIDSIEKIQAAISMVAKSTIGIGEYVIDANQDIISILINHKTLEGVRRLRQSAGPVLYASLYLTAIEHAIRTLTDNDEDHLWIQALRKTLHNHNIQIDDDLKENANRHAQNILEESKSKLKPLGLMVEWNQKRMDGENDDSD